LRKKTCHVTKSSIFTNIIFEYFPMQSLLKWTRQNSVRLALLVYFGLLLVLAFTFEGTGDDGDSVLHYLSSRYALEHPWLFFDHWAKPVFVLLTFPFAQLGFVGMKIFNSLCTCLALYFTYHSAKALEVPDPHLAPFFGALMPMYFVLTLSGLLEPLTALLLILAVFLEAKDRSLAAALIISFLPFVRYEGLIMIGIWAIFYGLSQKWRYLPFLLTGHVVYGLAGASVHGSVFWVITGNSNAAFWSYGPGNWLHFILSLIYVIGVPLYILWWLGLAQKVKQLFQKRRSETERSLFRKEFWLVYGSMTAFLLAHTLFYVLGIFKSLGMLRVLLSIAPLLAIVCLRGWGLIFGLLPKRLWTKGLQLAVLAYILIFPFTSNPAAINWKRDLHLHPTQVLLEDVADFLRKQYPERIYFYTMPYLSMLLDIDHFDVAKHRPFGAILREKIPEGAILIWDDWFSVMDDGVPLSALEQLPEWQKMQTFEIQDRQRQVQYVIFEYRTPSE